MIVFIVFILGCILGSFANVLIYRIPKRISIIFPNSFCPSCKTPIKYYDNIPIISYFLLKGRCRTCKNSISISYPLIEFFCGLLAILCYLKFGFLNMWVVLNFLFILLVISVIDIKTFEIPDELSYYLIFSGLVFSVFNPLVSRSEDVFIKIVNSLIGGLAGFIFSYLIGLLGNFFFKKPALGGGDIKLFTAVGVWLGFFAIFKIFFFSSVFALVYIVVFYFYKKSNLWGKYIQFAPFISLGCFFYVFI